LRTYGERDSRKLSSNSTPPVQLVLCWCFVCSSSAFVSVRCLF